MARVQHGHPDLRADVPTLEPDEAFLARLSELAAGSGASHPPASAPSLAGWRVGLAAASVAAVVGGMAWLAAAVTGNDAPTPPRTPATQPTDSPSSEADPDVPTGGQGTGVRPDTNQESGGSDAPDGSTGGGGSVGSAPGGSAPADPGPGNQGADPGSQGQGNPPGNQGTNGQAGQPHGQAGQDHGQQDGKGDEVHGQDGQPHGQAGQEQGGNGDGNGGGNGRGNSDGD